MPKHLSAPTLKGQYDAIWTARQCKSFIDFNAENPDAGDLSPAADSPRKLRWQSEGKGKGKGKGKRGAARVIDFHLVGDELALLVMAYVKAKLKAKRAHVKPKDIKRS